MNWLAAALRSTVGRKFIMGLTGLFLCFFLVVHLAGNLLLYVGEEVYNDYAHKLHSNPEFLLIAEILLFSAFLFHILVAISLTGTNSSARAVRYAVKQTKVEGRVLNLFGWLSPDNTMVISGLIVFLFLVVHVGDFKFEWWWGEQMEELEPFAKAQVILADLSRIVIYFVGSVVLGVHVSHGLYSACQSLGLNHPKYMPHIRCASWIFGIVVALGFGTIPILFNFLQRGS